MKIFIWIFFNALILFSIQYFIPYNEALKEWVLVTWWIKTFFIGWVVLWLLNTTIKPILKILGLPFILLTLWLFSLVINSVILVLMQNIISILSIDWSTYSINWLVNFLIAVAILSIFNTIYSVLLKK